MSDDGNVLTQKITSHPQDSDQTTTEEVTYTRVVKAPAAAHGISGSWRMNKIRESDNALTNTYQTNGDELSMSSPTGEGYTAKLDGKDYPVKGDYSVNSVSLKRINARAIQETQERDGTVIYVSQMTVSPDGKKMTVSSTAKLTGRTFTWVYDKQ